MSKRSGGADIETTRTSQRGVYCGAWSAFVDGVPQVYESSVRVTVPSRFFVLDAAEFGKFVRSEFPMAVHLLDGLKVGGLRQRRIIDQREKLLALGTITAGLTCRKGAFGSGIPAPPPAAPAAVGSRRSDASRLAATNVAMSRGRIKFCISACLRGELTGSRLRATTSSEVDSPQRTRLRPASGSPDPALLVQRDSADDAEVYISRPRTGRSRPDAAGRAGISCGRGGRAGRHGVALFVATEGTTDHEPHPREPAARGR